VSDALAARRQRAREAAHDAAPYLVRTGPGVAAIDEAIETATRVQITDEVLDAGYPSVLTERDRKLCRPLLAAAFRAAGFEVEE
jgi:hypothetical protein